MVKITNVFGDEYKGVQDNAIYQLHYGKQIRRKGYTESKTPSPKQLQVRQRFKDSTTWYKGLDFDIKKDIKAYFAKHDLSNIKGYPKTWYTYITYIYISNPTIRTSPTDSNVILINHPAIEKVQYFDSLGNEILVEDDLTDFSQDKVCEKYEGNFPLNATGLKVTTFAGLTKSYGISPPAPTTIYFDSDYFDSDYFA